ncbi:MAG: DNA processing protein [Parcubacteria group bacterium Gr01-1014_29]|nr:MAG: DNA processing protein [Parcubacteria group bacterium Gr01-1014_29]
MNTEVIFANAFNHIDTVGPRALAHLREHFGSYETAWRSGNSNFISALRNISDADDIAQRRAAIDPTVAYRHVEELDIALLLENDPVFPPRLREVTPAVACLYVQGALPDWNTPSLAVVGTRMPTTYGREACRSLVGPIAASGISIISGLAVGIDTEAHKACLSQKGKTIAVLGSGIARDSLYPAVNKHLADQIVAEGGAIVSEYPPCRKATQWTFPQRNRIIAGLANAVLVVEAKQKSGARITASLALELGRDVLAVPGSIFSANSWTPHALIRDGAVPVTTADDIYQALGILSPGGTQTGAEELPEAQAVLDCLAEPMSANDIARSAREDISTILRTLALLEIHGKVRNIGNGIYRRI